MWWSERVSYIFFMVVGIGRCEGGGKEWEGNRKGRREGVNVAGWKGSKRRKIEGVR